MRSLQQCAIISALFSSCTATSRPYNSDTSWSTLRRFAVEHCRNWVGNWFFRRSGWFKGENRKTKATLTYICFGFCCLLFFFLLFFKQWCMVQCKTKKKAILKQVLLNGMMHVQLLLPSSVLIPLWHHSREWESSLQLPFTPLFA